MPTNKRLHKRAYPVKIEGVTGDNGSMLVAHRKCDYGLLFELHRVYTIVLTELHAVQVNRYQECSGIFLEIN